MFWMLITTKDTWWKSWHLHPFAVHSTYDDDNCTSKLAFWINYVFIRLKQWCRHHHWSIMKIVASPSHFNSLKIWLLQRHFLVSFAGYLCWHPPHTLCSPHLLLLALVWVSNLTYIRPWIILLYRYTSRFNLYLIIIPETPQTKLYSSWSFVQ